MPLSFPFTYPFFTGGASSVDIAGIYDVALNGIPLMLDLEPTYNQRFHWYSVAQIRQQADGGQSPSEASINPDDLWRRSEDTWASGAGQSFLDRGDSDPSRFNTSKGVDVWTKWQISLLHDTNKAHTSANTNLALVTVGSYLYYADGQTLRRTQDITVVSPSWTTITGTDASTIQSITSDGYTVYLAQAAGVYTTTRGAAACTGTPYNNLVCTLLRYVNGRLMAANTNSIYNITASGAAPSALLTHPNSDFVWVDFAEGPTAIYAAGFSGDKSIIYKTSIKADGTALDVPTVAGTLPDGEIVRSLQGYLGFLLVGSDKGLRLAAIDSVGNLSFGALIPTTSAVRCFEPQDRFCWFGLTNYDGISTGLGRVDLSVETSPTTPAYASDLMATTQGTVLSVATFQNIRCFAVSGTGVYAETTAPVASGSLDSGAITYRLPDDKVALFVDVRHDQIGQHAVWFSDDGGAFTLVGSHTTSSDPFAISERRGFRFEVRIVLTAIGGISPIIRSITLRSYPTANTVMMIDLPIIIAEKFKTHDGVERRMDTTLVVEQLKDLRRTRELVPLQVGELSSSVTVSDIDWRPTHLTNDSRSWNGTFIATLKEIHAA